MKRIEKMDKIHIDYVMMTLNSQKLRIAIGNQKGMAPIVYSYDMEPGEFGEEYYSYRAYFNSLTEEQGYEIQRLIEENSTRKAHNYFLKYFQEDEDKCLGPCGPVQLSDLVPDEWFYGCKWVMSMLSSKRMKGVFSCDYEVDY